MRLPNMPSIVQAAMLYLASAFSLHAYSLSSRRSVAEALSAVSHHLPHKAEHPPTTQADISNDVPFPMTWYAIGDSYTSAPGVGEDFDTYDKCIRNNGSYATQLHHDFPFAPHRSSDLHFTACSGETTVSLLDKGFPAPYSSHPGDTQLPPRPAEFVLMTLGGNDVGFGDLALHCFVRPHFRAGKNCVKVIDKARKYLYNAFLETHMHRVYDGIFGNMLPGDREDQQLYHILYPRFFNETTKWCNHLNYDQWPLQPVLSELLRHEANKLVDELNARLKEIANRYIRKQRGQESWRMGSRLIVVDLEAEGTFQGHRFCEGEEKPKGGLENKDVWIFGTFDDDNEEEKGKKKSMGKRDEVGAMSERFVGDEERAAAVESAAEKKGRLPGRGISNETTEKEASAHTQPKTGLQKRGSPGWPGGGPFSDGPDIADTVNKRPKFAFNKRGGLPGGGGWKRVVREIQESGQEIPREGRWKRAAKALKKRGNFWLGLWELLGGEGPKFIPEDLLLKSFHPKTKGHTAIKDLMKRVLEENRRFKTYYGVRPSRE